MDLSGNAHSSSCLVGHTGFVGGNLVVQTPFTQAVNSKTIGTAYGKTFDLVVCCGVSATKWRANQFPDEDLQAIDKVLGDLANIRARRFALISTVDVFPDPNGVDETSDPHLVSNHPYGAHRLYVEDSIKAMYQDVTIVRLPGMFGPGLKKNVIFDLLHDNSLAAINADSTFQYYDVTRLWADLQRVLACNFPLVHLATEPVATREIAARYFPDKQIGTKPSAIASYNVKSRHAEEFGGANGYLYNAPQVLDQLGGYFATFREGVAA
jgi:dTDP-4-dehydrorhamnose reductase